ncbi:MAG: 1-acyl-sn-glycerol-3-phosphate acyltransferase [Phycisphaerae bacterium]|nr:1-acyl-sn-glycerol-3-phosphate acyltransferase [Phycisphaerae bacterium]NIX27990.1 hypothetical protein [Phycisphaerae bacterium]
MNKYRFLKIIFTVIIRLLTKTEVRGTEYIPQDIPFILAVNHLTILESPVLFVVLPVKQVTVLVARKWEKHLLNGWLIKSVEGIFVNRDEIDRQALQAALDVLKAGGILGMAPEGTRSRTDGLIRAKAGIAYLATKANVPVLPIGISGQKDFMQKFKRLRRPHLLVNIGEPICLPSVIGPNRGRRLQKYADEIMVAIARLIEPELRGVYAAAAEATLPSKFQ